MYAKIIDSFKIET